MASPTPPILSALILEALKRAGYSNPTSELQARARERWIEEIKAEIWARARDLKALQTKAVTILTKGIAQYDNPDDYAANMTITFASGSRYGTAQGGASGSITLAASDGGLESDTVGREVVITSGTGVEGIATVSAFNPSTKVATVSPNFTTAPTAGSGYVVLDDYRPMTEAPVWDYQNVFVPGQNGYPELYFPLGDSTNGKILVHPVPWRDDSQPMVLIQRYQADLTEADSTGTLLLTLYQKWQPLWIAGLRWKCFQNDDDNRATSAFQEYQKSLRDITNAEVYGNTLGDLQARVSDY